MHTGLVLATSQGGAAFGNLLILLLPLLLLLFLFRSQRRRTREMANLQQSLVVGDEVVVVLKCGLRHWLIRPSDEKLRAPSRKAQAN